MSLDPHGTMASTLLAGLGPNVRLMDKAYRDLKRLGAGTYGDVYRAVDRATGTPAALKQMKLDAEGDGYGFPLTALREIQILKQLRHDNIIRLLEVVVTRPAATATAKDDGGGDDTARPAVSPRGFNAVYLALPLCECDLEGYLKSCPLGKGHVKSFSFQLLAALAHIEARCIAHRDIKPANVFVTSNNVVKLADWGLARHMNRLARPDRGQPLPDYSKDIVTLQYRAPEVMLCGSNASSGVEGHYGCAVDVWSVGCIVAELLIRPAKPWGPVFNGQTETTQLEAIWSICGAPAPGTQWPNANEAAHRRIWEALKPDDPTMPDRIGEEWERVGHFDDDALELVRGLLRLDPTQRTRAAAALRHPYFKGRARVAELAPLRRSGLVTALQAGEKKKKRDRELRERNMELRRGGGGSGGGRSSSSGSGSGAAATTATAAEPARKRAATTASAAWGTGVTGLKLGLGFGGSSSVATSTTNVAAPAAHDPWRRRRRSGGSGAGSAAGVGSGAGSSSSSSSSGGDTHVAAKEAKEGSGGGGGGGGAHGAGGAGGSSAGGATAAAVRPRYALTRGRTGGWWG